MSTVAGCREYNGVADQLANQAVEGYDFEGMQDMEVCCCLLGLSCDEDEQLCRRITRVGMNIMK